MKRDFIDRLRQWKDSKTRKPLIVQGARQVGKTWIIQEFGKLDYQNTIYLNFESSLLLRNLFEIDFNIDRIIDTIEIESKQKINPQTTLIILDEIQEAKYGLTSLKYFYENAPQYHILAAGSLLGISLQREQSFPVGKVDLLHLYPLSFTEFLSALGEDRLVDILKNQDWKTISIFHSKLEETLRLYYYIGGMPEVISSYIEYKDLYRVREIQSTILKGYEYDFGKYAPNQIQSKLRLVWNSILSQLAKENRKFTYGLIKTGGRAKEFEQAIQWLVDAGLVLKTNLVSKPSIPLRSYANYDAFKLFFLDIGLLNALGEVEPQILIHKNKILTEFKGALTEQFVCQQLKLTNELYYWSSETGIAEIDFLLTYHQDILPLEVKAEENLKSKSLKFFGEKYTSKIQLRTSMSPYRTNERLINFPLYSINFIKEILDKSTPTMT